MTFIKLEDAERIVHFLAQIEDITGNAEGMLIDRLRALAPVVEVPGAIDEALDFFDPGPRARACGDGDRADRCAAARSELQTLREKAEGYDALERVFPALQAECASLMEFKKLMHRMYATCYRADRDQWEITPEFIELVLSPEERETWKSMQARSVASREQA